LIFRKIDQKVIIITKIFILKGQNMLKKLTPLFVLALFALGAYLMMKGMDNAVEMTKTKKEITK